jgi:hypothetical protein
MSHVAFVHKGFYSNSNTNNTLISDEENTSEYSLTHSSQHSTLESIPDTQKNVLKCNEKHIKLSKCYMDDEDFDHSLSEDDINNNDKIDESEHSTATVIEKEKPIHIRVKI